MGPKFIVEEASFVRFYISVLVFSPHHCLYLTVYTLVLTSGRTAVFLIGFANQFCFDIFIDPPLELTTVSRSKFRVEYDATHEILI